MRALIASLTWWEWVLLWCVVSVPVALLVGRIIKIGRGPWLLLILLLPSPAFAQDSKPAPWYLTGIAVAGPLVDGVSTKWAINQSGPYAQVREGNRFYARLFGSDVTPNEILAFKIAQGALYGLLVRETYKQNKAAAIGFAVAQAAIHTFVSVRNVRAGRQAGRLNR